MGDTFCGMLSDMPWKVTDPVNERMQFVARWRAGERISDLCREFGISRKTGHKLCARFEGLGLDGLKDLSRRPHHSPNRTPRDIVAGLLELRARYPTWGPKKLRECYGQRNPGVRVPAASTIGAILDTAGVVRRRKRRRQATPSSTLRTTTAPNELWCIDFKGQFRLGNKSYCYPLTVTDHFSRFLLCCEALETTRRQGVQSMLEELFSEQGLPDAMRSDNGSPFASTGRCGLSRLSVWLLRLGVEIERITPGHPEQNGRHERMHLTLKQDATRPAGDNILQQQERFDAFRASYNSERPHEALGMKPPSAFYLPSRRKPPSSLQPLDYPLHDQTVRVAWSGHVKLNGTRSVFIGEAFAGENIGFRQLTPVTWLVSFMEMDIGYVDGETGRFLQIDVFEPEAALPQRSEQQVLPMSPV